VPLIAIGRRREEVLAPGLDPLHRPAEPARDHRDQHLLGIRVALDAEAAATSGASTRTRDSPSASAVAMAPRTE